MEGKKKYTNKKKNLSSYRKIKGRKKMRILEKVNHVSHDETQNKPRCSKTLDVQSTSTHSREENMSISSKQLYVPNTKFNVEGRRLVDIGYLFKKIAQINYQPYGCNFSNLLLVGEQNIGFYGEFLFTCKMCRKNEIIESENPNSSLMDVNTTTVTVIVNSGQGFAQLETFSAIMNMPNMCNKLYQKLHEDVYKFTNETAWEAMSLAAEEEAKLAVATGNVRKDGVPMITVIADGAWVVLLVQEQKKFFFLGIRNKYCLVCVKAEATSSESPIHKCYKNWEGTSTAMESDIILEGFRQSINMHNLIYHKLIGDGDSSVIKKLRIAQPYGPKCLIKKIECKNHILRNYLSKLNDMAAKRKCSSGKVVPGYLRTILKDNKLRIRYGITKAIAHWKNNRNLTHSQKEKFLKKDIDNGPYHVFGYHNNCHPYFCKAEPNSINYVPEIENCGFLIYDVTNNYVESYNSIVAKFVGSYNTRCMTAVSAFNFGPEYIRKLHKTATKESPRKFTKRFICKLQRAKEIRLKTNKMLNFRPSTKMGKTFSGADKDYGDLDELECAELEISPEEQETKRSTVLNSLKLSSQEIVELERNTIDQGKSETWHTERKYRLTASNFGRVCKLRKTTPRANTVKYVLYGIQYEPMVKEAFESIFNVKVLPASLFVDEQYNFLTSSPDGLVGENEIIEIKCPHNSKDIIPPHQGVVAKKIKFLNICNNGDLQLNKNHNYYYQIQGQLRVANKLSCYFIVWTPKDMFVEIITRDEDFWRNKMEKQLVEFYNCHLLHEIVNPKILKQMTIF
ncbi:hypothetical protein QTP88_020571 [Uroleucon formosanum]